jgi:hypothetical protein
VGSDSKDSSGEALSGENRLKLADPYNLRLKRLQETVLSILAILTFPVHLVAVRRPFSFFRNCFAVLLARKTWVGYAVEEKYLPKLRPGVLACNGIPATGRQELPMQSLQMVDYWYARDYEPAQDLRIIWKGYRRLGG